MRLFDNIRDIAVGISYLLKFFPSYLFGCSILGNIILLNKINKDTANAQSYAIAAGLSSKNINLYDWS